MARVKLPIKGQTANKQQDGECRAIINMRPTREGHYVPVTPRREMKKLNRLYDHLIYHKTSSFEHLIGIVDNKVYIFPEEMKNELLFQTSEKINRVEQLGNAISLICTSSISTLLWNNGEYKLLSDLPSLPAYEISVSETTLKLTLNAADGLGTNNEEGNEDRERIYNRIKNAVGTAQDLIINGGTDKIDKDHEAKGQHLFDAHILQYAYRLYDGSLTKYSPPILLMPGMHISELKTAMWDFNTSDWSVIVTGYQPKLTPTGNWYNSRWDDIIQSIDFFISPPLNMSSVENMTDKHKFTAEEFFGGDYWLPLIEDDKKRDIENISNTGTLYLLHSLPYKQTSNSKTVEFKDERGIENIQYSELLPVDTGSNHTTGAKSSYVYNSRLHLGNIKTTFYNGHSARSFCYLGNYNGINSLARAISGTRPAYNWGKITYDIIVTLKIDGREETVVRSYTQPTAIENSISAMLSYPDPRAVRMVIIANSPLQGRVKMCDVPLTEHKYMNIAYHVDPELKPIGHVFDWDAPSIPGSATRTSIEPSRLRVSAINNPFSYPNTNNYQIGNGEIITMGTQAQRISEGSFGQYPLFIFTSTGIYSLQIGQGEILYSNQIAPVTYETPISSLIAETPYGIIFISSRGLCNISGQQVELISESIDQLHDYIMIYANNIPEAEYPNIEFEDYLQNVEAIIYNPYHNEVIITCTDCNYSYIYHINSKSFWMSTEEMRLQVRNTFPELYVHGSNALKSMKQSREKSTRVAMITHPIDFGSPDTKQMERTYVRTLLHNANIGEIDADTPEKMLVNLYSSMDGVNFNLARGLMLQQDGSYKGIDMGLMARTRSKYFMFAIAGTISEGSTVEYVEFITKEVYTNEKMR